MFKWVAALSMDLGPILLPSVVPIVMPALQRETNENNPNTGKKQKHSTTPLLPPPSKYVNCIHNYICNPFSFFIRKPKTLDQKWK